MTDPITPEVQTSTEQIEQEVSIPTPEEYSELFANYHNLSQQTEQLSRAISDRVESGNRPTPEEIQFLQQTAKDKNHTLSELKKARNSILAQTNAVEIDDGFVELSPGTDKNNSPLIRVSRVWGSISVQAGQAFTGNLSNAPKNFREKMFQGPYLINFDGTLDVSTPWRNILETESQSPQSPALIAETPTPELQQAA